MTIQQILKEATDFSTGTAVLTSIDNGEAGISAKKFFEDVDKNERWACSILFGKVIEDCEQYRLNRTKVIKLLLTKAQTLRKLLDGYKGIDPYVAYYKNIDKKEAKTIHKELFDGFIKPPLSSAKDNDFENKVNTLFADKAQVKNKEKEINQLYGPDAQGWETFIPLTFAAASKYSTTKDGKTVWCTAANKANYDGYTRNGPLYIIKNHEKGLAYQINFREDGENYNYYGKYMVEFMDKDNERPNRKDAVRNILDKIPAKALEVVSFKGKSFSGLKTFLRTAPSSLPKAFKKTNFGDWRKESYHIDNKSQIITLSKDSFRSISEDTIRDFFNDKEKDIGQVDFYRHKSSFGKSYMVINSSSSHMKNSVLYDNNGEIDEVNPEDVPKEIYKFIYKVEKKDNKVEVERTKEYTIWETRINGVGRKEKVKLNLSFQNDIRVEKNVGDVAGYPGSGAKEFFLNNFNIRNDSYVIKFTRAKAAEETMSYSQQEEAIVNLFTDYTFEDPKSKASILRYVKKVYPNIGSELLSASLDEKRFGNLNKDRKQNVIDAIKRVKGKLNDNTTDSK